MQKLKLFIVTLLISGMALIGSVEGWAFYRFVSAPLSSISAPKVITIPAGSHAKQVANILYENQIIHHPTWFYWWLRMQEKGHLLKAGEYEIQPGWHLEDLIDHLISGKSIEYPVTFISGHTMMQSLKKMRQLENIQHSLPSDINLKALAEKLGITESAEGQILPETYYYRSGEKDTEILLRAHKKLQKVLQKAWQTRQKDLPLKSPYEALILASIVEKETGYEPERPMIAGVFINRLRKKMRLQSDPTIIYGMGDRYDGNIRKKDIRKKTAYNTYRINGLPPTPIALPSADAIQAVCQPAKTSALYFVAKGGGQHYFSKTLQEHNRAVRKYLLKK